MSIVEREVTLCVWIRDRMDTVWIRSETDIMIKCVEKYQRDVDEDEHYVFLLRQRALAASSQVDRVLRELHRTRRTGCWYEAAGHTVRGVRLDLG